MVEEEGNWPSIALRSILESQGCQLRDHTEHVLLPRAGDSKEE